MVRLLCAAVLLVAACERVPDPQAKTDLASADIRSGYHFLTPDTQRLQDDTFENPGYLWVDRGAALFETSQTDAPSCGSCHEDKLTGVAARYPAFDDVSGTLINLEGRINQCRETQQGLPSLPYESDDLLALTTYVANQSKGVPVSVEISERTQPFLEAGRTYFLTRRGQLNLSCQQCHTENWGKQLRGDMISQGHSNGFPAYRLEWQSVGSSHRRLRDCDTGVRAEPLPFGDPIYVAVELYLAARGEELEIESPAVRR
ncbi:MAG: sulfur oxidation c-type cytochrome SoxA [Pseudomonadota bacterium]